MRFTKTISVRISREAISEEKFDLSIQDFRNTIAEMGDVYREDDYEVNIRVGDNEDQKWQCTHCFGWYLGTKQAASQTPACEAADHDWQKVEG